MKKLICVLTLACIMSNIFAQVPNNPKTDFFANDIDQGKYYKQKSKNQKTTAWVLLGFGTIMGTVGVQQMLSEITIFSGPVESSNTGEALFLLGTASALTSIPLFILSSKNKTRARILLSEHKIPLSFSTDKNIPVRSIGIGIKIGR